MRSVGRCYRWMPNRCVVKVRNQPGIHTSTSGRFLRDRHPGSRLDERLAAPLLGILCRHARAAQAAISDMSFTEPTRTPKRIMAVSAIVVLGEYQTRL